MQGLHRAGDRSPRPASSSTSLILLFTSHDSLRLATSTTSRARAPTTRPWPPGRPRTLYPEQGGYDTHNDDRRRSTTRSRSTIYVYWGAYLSAEFKGGGAAQAAARPRCGPPASATLLIMLLAIAIFMQHGRLRLLRLGLQRQPRGAGRRAAIGSAGYVYFAEPRREQQRAGDACSALAFLGWFLPACYTQAAMVQRAIMTWSFDGLLPRRLRGGQPDAAHRRPRRSWRRRCSRSRWRRGSVTATTSSSTSRSPPSRRTRRSSWSGSRRR